MADFPALSLFAGCVFHCGAVTFIATERDTPVVGRLSKRKPRAVVTEAFNQKRARFDVTNIWTFYLENLVNIKKVFIQSYNVL